MPDRRLLIASRFLEQMKREAVTAAPNECCGLLIGRRNPVSIVTKLEPCANLHPEPTRFFTLDPARQITLLRALRDSADEMLLGHYHSHPTGPAAPSPRDLAAANDAALIWLVIDAKSLEIGGFLPREDPSGRIVAFDPLSIIATPA
jgi:proteasome lid subunit RPN8/RPN11